MKNNKGFTLVELAVTFSLVAVISIMLFQLISNLKELYLSGDVKTSLLNRQGIMVKKIATDFHDNIVQSINSCGVSCLTFSLQNPDSLDTKTTELMIDPGNKTVTYDSYTYQLDKSSSFGTVNFEVSNTTDSLGNAIFKIDIPIYSKLIPDESFGINVVGLCPSSNINRNIDSNASFKINGIDTNLKVVEDSEGRIKGVFAKLYNLNNGNTIDKFDDFLYNPDTNKLSALGGLGAFKKTNDIQAIVGLLNNEINNDGNLSTSQKRNLTTHNEEIYQNGYYTFLLTYNDVFNTNYWWSQTSNFANKESLDGYFDKMTFDRNVSHNALNNGIDYSESDEGYAAINNYKIGLKSGSLAGPVNNPSSVQLYVDARAYICKYSLSNIIYNGESLTSYKYSDYTDFCG